MDFPGKCHDDSRDPTMESARNSASYLSRVSRSFRISFSVHGVLVSERKFDFRPKSEETPLFNGKISRAIDDLEEIGRDLYQKTFKIHLRVKQVGTGPLRYTLQSFEPTE